jgi:hypothetical protein
MSKKQNLIIPKGFKGTDPNKLVRLYEVSDYVLLKGLGIKDAWIWNKQGYDNSIDGSNPNLYYVGHIYEREGRIKGVLTRASILELNERDLCSSKKIDICRDGAQILDRFLHFGS